jgi:DNA topoisomerase I
VRAVTGRDFTAKDFGTWGGTVIAALALQEPGEFESQSQAKHNITQVIKTAAGELGNTPTVCRKCYVHPGIIEAYEDGSLLRALASYDETKTPKGLRPAEARVLAFLQGCSPVKTGQSR